MQKSEWFNVDKEGLALLLKRRGYAFVLYELLQNAWDTDARYVRATFEPIPGAPQARIVVEDDDPEGFQDLRHAFTLFASSPKKSDPTKRGRFDLGEKLVLAACRSAEISTTKGTVVFDETGRHERRVRRECGSVFEGVLRITRDEYEEAASAVEKLIPPSDKVTVFNGRELPTRSPIHSFEVTLPTEVSDAEGYLRRTARKTTVRVYERREGETSSLYEMGIPVVELDDPWDVEVLQKIPLTTERDNVTPAYLRELRVAVINAMHDRLSREDVARTAVQEALSDHRISPEAVSSIVGRQYGENRVIFDPSDREATNKSVAHGYTVIAPGAFNKDQWANIRKAGAAKPAGHIFPSKKPYSDDPDAPVAEVIPEEKWTPDMRGMATYAEDLGGRLLGHPVRVRFENRFGAMDAANYGQGELCFNVGRLGYKWFEQGITRAVHELLIHEFAHDFGDHLTREFDDGLARLGAKMVEIALKDPGFFTYNGYRLHRG